MIQFRLPYFASDWHPGDIAFTKVISRKVPVVPRPQKGPRPIVEPAYNDRLEDTDSPENGLSLLISHHGSMRMLYLPTFYHQKSTKCILYLFIFFFMFYEALDTTDSQGSSMFLLWRKNGIEHLSICICITLFMPTWRAFVTFSKVKWPPTLGDKQVALNHLVDIFFRPVYIYTGICRAIIQL